MPPAIPVAMLPRRASRDKRPRGTGALNDLSELGKTLGTKLKFNVHFVTLAARSSVRRHNLHTLWKQARRLMPMINNHRFVKSTQWMRPVIRWSTRFSLNSPRWLPSFVRHAPLRLSSFILRCYHLALR